MATILNDVELKRLLGAVIVDGDASCLRPNSYVLRLGSTGEFLNTSKEFELDSKKKKGLRIPAGHSVAVTSLETLDFRRETVHKFYPGQDLHGLLSPTTDLSREGIVAPTTQVDAGFHGTLNWTLNNTSPEERRFLHRERIYRLTIFRLEDGEKPEHLYQGTYQEQLGYVRSRRTGPPIGMKEGEWEDAFGKAGGPEDLLDNLMKSGYPWHILGKRLKEIDEQFKTVSAEYADIHDTLGQLSGNLSAVREKQNDTPDVVRKVLREETETHLPEVARRVVREESSAIQNRSLVGAGSVFMAIIGAFLAVMASPPAISFFKDHGVAVGGGLIAIAVVALIALSRQK